MARKQEIFGVNVEGDITGLKKAMNDAVAVLNSTERAIRNIDKAIDSDPNDINLLKTKVDYYVKAIEEAKRATQELRDREKDIYTNPNFKESITDRSERMSELQKKIRETAAEEKRLTKELEKAQKAVSNFTFDQKMRKVSEELEASKKNVSDIAKSLATVDKQLQLDPDNIDLYAKRQELLGKQVSAVVEQLDVLYKKRKLLADGRFHIVDESEKQELAETDLAIQNLHKSLDTLLNQRRSAEVDRFVSQVETLKVAFNDMADRTRVFSKTFQTLLASAFNSSVDFESSIAGIRKVVKDLSEDTVNDLKDIAVETGNTFDEIANYATIGGALGLAEKDLSKFTRAMIDLNTVSGGAFAGEEGAKGVAVFLNQLNLGIDQAENFGSAIAVIGDKYADIGDETVNVATKLTGLNSIVKTNQYELIGLAGVMADLGLATDSNANGVNRAFIQIDKVINGGVKDAEAKLEEMAHTAGMTSDEFKQAWGENAVDAFLNFTDGLKSSVFNEINKAISTSSKDVQEYANVLGVSAEQFTKMWGEDSRTVFDKYIEALGDLGEDGTVASKVLGDLGIASIITAQTLLRLAGNGNEVRDAIKLTEKAWTENTALMEKSSIIYETTERKIEAFKESWRQLAASFTDLVLPAVKNVMDSLSQMMKDFSNSPKAVKGLILAFAGLSASISPAFKGMQNLMSVVQMFMGTPTKLLKYNEALGTFEETIGTMPSSFQMLKKAMSTSTGQMVAAGAGIFAITTALIGGTVALGKYLDKAENASTPLRKLKDNIRSVADELTGRTTSASNDMALLDYSIYRETYSIQEQITAIEELQKKLKDGSLTDEEAKATKEELTKKIDELNGALGTTYYYDSKQKEILDENKDVANLTKAYENLILEKRRSSYLAQYEDEYNKALSDQSKALQTIADAKWEYAEATKGYDQELVAFAQEYAKNPMGRDVQEIFNSLGSSAQTAVIQIADMYLKAVDTVEASKDVVRNTDTIIKNFEGLSTLNGDELKSALDALKNGWNIDPAKNDLQELYTQLEKVQYLLANPEGLNAEQIAQFGDFEKEIQDQIKEVEAAQGKVNELNEKKNATFDDIKVGLDGIKTKNTEVYSTDADSILNTTDISWDTIRSTIVDSTTSALSDYKTQAMEVNGQIVKFYQDHPVYQDIYIRTRKASGSGSGSYSGPFFSGGFSSSGFGDLAGAVRKSIINSVNGFQGKMASGGVSNSVVLNNSFVLNNANVTEQMARDFADSITDRINENLGRDI